MLTRTDLDQISKLLDERFDKRLSETEQKFDLKLEKLEERIIGKLNLVISGFEDGNRKLEKRIERIERHLGIN